MVWPRIPGIPPVGSTVGLVTVSAPEAHANPEHVRRGIAWLESRGISVKWAEHALDSKGFLADDPQALARDIHSLLADTDVDWVLTTGGGSNANSLLPYLDTQVLKANPKPIVGLSNSTALLNFLSSATGVVTFHGPVLIWNLGNETPIDRYTEDHLWRALSKNDTSLRIIPEPDWAWLRAGKGNGRIWGGNLWSFQQLLGTPFIPDLRGAILFIEECFTELHVIEAMLTHLRHAGVLDRLSGLIVGKPLECRESEMPDGRDFERVVADACAEFPFPILAHVSLGHTDRKITTPIGATAYMDSSANELRFGAI